MFSIFILIYIVNYIIILLVLVNFISNNFKIFWNAEQPTGPNSLTIAKMGNKTLRLLKSVLYKHGRGWFRMSLRILPS